MRAVIDTSMPPQFARYLWNVAELMPNSRHNSGTASPASVRLSASMNWLSVNLDRFTPHNSSMREFDFCARRACGGITVSTALIVNESGQRMILDTLQRRFREARRAASVGDEEFQFRDLRAKAEPDKTDSSGDIRQARKQLGTRQWR